MARRDLLDGFMNGRISEREFVTRLVATGMTLAAAVAFALSLAGSAGSATQARSTAAHAARSQVASFYGACASASDFYGTTLEISQCPAYFSPVGSSPYFDFWVSATQPVTWNLDSAMVDGTLVWRPASHGLSFRGLAPGYHTIQYRTAGAFGDLVAGYTWITPGAAPEAVAVASFGPSNSKAVITWGSQIPAWRTYCSVNGSVEKICRQPSGLSLNGLPAGVNSITIRATNGPDDPGRSAAISFDRADPAGTLSISTEGPWGYTPV